MAKRVSEAAAEYAAIPSQKRSPLHREQHERLEQRSESQYQTDVQCGLQQQAYAEALASRALVS